jgi:hypothetical protein
VTLLQPEQTNTRKPSRSPIGDRSARWVIGAPQASHAQAGALSSVLTGSGMAPNSLVFERADSVDDRAQ